MLLTARVGGIETIPTLLVLGKFAGRFLCDLLKPLFYTYLFPFFMLGSHFLFLSGLELTTEAPEIFKPFPFTAS